MGSLKGAGTVALILGLTATLAFWVTDRAIELEASGAPLSSTWRLVLSGTKWYVRLQPLAAIVGLPLGALIGGYRSRHAPVDRERQALLAWIVLAVMSLTWFFVPGTLANLDSPWLDLAVVVLMVGGVAPLAAIGTAAHLQSRIRDSLQSRVQGWQILAGSLLLCLLGPALLGPPLWVWVRARNVQAKTRPG